MVLRLSRVFLLLFITVLFSGCAAIMGHGDSLQTFDKTLKSHVCDYSFVKEKIEDGDDVILWASQGGSQARNCFDYEKSNSFFDKSERAYKQDVDLQSAVGKVGESTGSILINNNVNEYQGNVYEKVMLNTYKGLNFMALGDFANARVEFNRALDRQRRAKEHFSSEIKKIKQQHRKDKNYNKASNRYTQEAILDNFKDIFSEYDAYPDFINPYTTYISGIFFLLDRDYAKARDILKDSLAMEPNNTQIRADFELADRLSGFAKKEKYYAWIIYENGQSMAKRETRINIPLFIFTNKVYYAGIALPKLYARSSSYAYLQVEDKKTKMIADIDRVMVTEFEKNFSRIALEATMNLIAKIYAQYELNRSSELGGLLGALYQGLTNRADIRSWTALPKNFQSLRIELDENPVIIKDDKGRVISTLHVENNTDVLIYVKSSARGDTRVHKIIKGRR